MSTQVKNYNISSLTKVSMEGLKETAERRGLKLKGDETKTDIARLIIANHEEMDVALGIQEQKKKSKKEIKSIYESEKIKLNKMNHSDLCEIAGFDSNMRMKKPELIDYILELNGDTFEVERIENDEPVLEDITPENANRKSVQVIIVDPETDVIVRKKMVQNKPQENNGVAPLSKIGTEFSYRGRPNVIHRVESVDTEKGFSHCLQIEANKKWKTETAHLGNFEPKIIIHKLGK